MFDVWCETKINVEIRVPKTKTRTRKRELGPPHIKRRGDSTKRGVRSISNVEGGENRGSKTYREVSSQIALRGIGVEEVLSLSTYKGELALVRDDLRVCPRSGPGLP